MIFWMFYIHQFLDGPSLEIELWPKQQKFLELGPLLRKKCFIELPLEGDFLSLTDIVLYEKIKKY
jgi:hypothetical protein